MKLRDMLFAVALSVAYSSVSSALAAETPTATGKIGLSMDDGNGERLYRASSFFAGDDTSISHSNDLGFVEGSISPSPLALVSARAESYIDEPNTYVTGSAEFKYYLQVTGQGEAVVPVAMRAFMEYGAAGGNSGSSAGLYIHRLGQPTPVYFAEGGAFGNSVPPFFGPEYTVGYGSRNIDTILNLTANQIYQVRMIAVANAERHPVDGDGGSYGWANVDPNFTIVGRNSGYVLEFSPGVANTPFDLAAAVPEPATWAMLLLGFFGLGGAFRWRNGQGRLRLAGEA